MDRIFSSDLAPITDPIVLKSSGLPETYSAASQSCCCSNPDDLGADSVWTWASIVRHFDLNISEFFNLDQTNFLLDGKKKQHDEHADSLHRISLAQQLEK